MKKAIKYTGSLITLLGWVAFHGCSSQKFLPEGAFVLSGVTLRSSQPKEVRAADYRGYVRQEPNTSWFNLLKVPLGIYCLSGTDSTKGLNRFFQRLGEAPRLYDVQSTERSRLSLESALQNRGYFQASVSAVPRTKSKKIRLAYHLQPGKRYIIRRISRAYDDDEVRTHVENDTLHSLLQSGEACNLLQLDQERNRLITMLQNKGYYKIQKDFITYRLDSCAGDTAIDLYLRFQRVGVDTAGAYRVYHVGQVEVMSDVSADITQAADSTVYQGITFRYNRPSPIRLATLRQPVILEKGRIFRERDVQTTNTGLDALSAVKYTTMLVEEADSDRLNYRIWVNTTKRHNLSAELEGTNTSGDLGAAAAMTYTNRNLFRGSEMLTLRLKGTYEAITGLEGYSDQNYVELVGEMNLKFPQFLAPFLHASFRNRFKAESELSLLYHSQDRPEFHRRVLTAGWNYRWTNANRRKQHKLDALSFHYVFMPWISQTFREEYLDSANTRNSLIRYMYENLFIMRSGYSYVFHSAGNTAGNLYQTNSYQWRLNVETAGNLLYGLSKLLGVRKDEQAQYNLFNVAFAQYVKADADFSKSFRIDERNSLAVHLGVGIAAAYGNAAVVPYEKRYFSGGANSVRGWNVRGLGPGSYQGKNGVIDFLHQTGDVKLDANIEYRTYLFWKLHGAAFIDAGNIWTLRNTDEQPGGQFAFNTFYKQIAVSYGLGVRINFDYFILRFDAGMKAINPTAPPSSNDYYPLFHPHLARDLTFHFAVGLPF